MQNPPFTHSSLRKAARLVAARAPPLAADLPSRAALDWGGSQGSGSTEPRKRGTKAQNRGPPNLRTSSAAGVVRCSGFGSGTARSFRYRFMCAYENTIIHIFIFHSNNSPALPYKIRGLKMAIRPFEASRWLQDGPRGQEGPKRGPRLPQDGPKSAQERPKSAPRGVQEAILEAPEGQC